MDEGAGRRLVDAITSFAPDVLLTHAERDPFNPDHPVAFAATERARQLANGAGVASTFKTIRPPQFLLFEPHQPELCGFVPTTFLDITPVFAKKIAALTSFGVSTVYEALAGMLIGALNVPVQLGGTTSRTGDYVLMDADGGVVITPERLDDVLRSSAAREQREATNREQFTSAVLSIDLYGLRDRLAPHLTPDTLKA